MKLLRDYILHERPNWQGFLTVLGMGIVWEIFGQPFPGAYVGGIIAMFLINLVTFHNRFNP